MVSSLHYPAVFTISEILLKKSHLILLSVRQEMLWLLSLCYPHDTPWLEFYGLMAVNKNEELFSVYLCCCRSLAVVFSLCFLPVCRTGM